MSPLANAPQTSESLEIWLTSSAAPAPFDPRKLSQAERERYERTRSPRKREEFELSRGLLQALPGVDLPQSLSHTRSFAAIARCTGGLSVGVDLEAHRLRDVVSLSRFAFDAVEADSLAAVEDPLALFYALWVLKEAAAKALNLELVQALKQCVFLTPGAKWQGALPTHRPWRAYVWRPRPALSLAAVVIGPRAQLVTNAIEWPANRIAWTEVVSLTGGGANAL